MRQFVLICCSMVLKDFAVGCLLVTVNDLLDDILLLFVYWYQ